MWLLVDNYDSFTYNLVAIIKALGLPVQVLLNDDPRLADYAFDDIRGMIFSPGPGRPAQAGFCMSLLNRFPPELPFLGVCLGHQALGECLGMNLAKAPQPMHGKCSEIIFQSHPLFSHIPSVTPMMRYHSLLLEPTPGHRARILAETNQKEVMAIQYPDRPWFGIQFHPESILSPHGPRLIENFLKAQ